MNREIWIERLTWSEVREALAAGYDTAVIMTASLEQHGPHLPLATDTLLGYAVGERVARKLGKALLAPVIRPGMSEHHMAFPGTITYSRETFVATLRDTCVSLIRHGFRRLAITWSHGGNAATLAEVVPELARAHPQIDFLLEADLREYVKHLQPVAERAGVDLETMGIHAGEVETSMMLAAAPDQVRPGLAVQGFMGDLVYPQGEHLKLLAEGLQTLTDSGVLGDARPADRQRGELYLEAAAEYMVANLKPVRPRG